MLRNLGIRWKVLAVLALPALVLAGVGGAVTVSALDEARAAQQAKMVSDAGERLGTALMVIDAERATSLDALRGEATARSELAAARARTDTALNALDGALSWTASDWLPNLPGTSLAVTAARDTLAEVETRLEQVRADTDVRMTGAAAPTAERRLVRDAFEVVADTAAQLPATVARQVGDRSLATRLDALAATSRAAEAMSEVQLTGLAVLRGGSGALTGQQDLAVATAEVEDAFGDLRTVATAEELHALSKLGDSETTVELARQTATLTSGSSAGRPSAAGWREATTAQQEQVRLLTRQVSRDASVQASAAADAAWLRVAVVFGLAVALVGASVLFALMVSRRIAAPLHRLTAVTSGLTEDLPGLAERVAAGQPVGDPPEVEHRGRDEVGRLAAAFGDMYATTIRMAEQQAQLRSSVTETFVTVARRNQVLLSRQLSFIDQLERTEEDPDILQELFRLDHLATRMRRNAESLLVLAGIDTGRRLRAPMPLSDVVRTAVSEIEQFERVAVRLSVDPPIASHLALGLAHLVAELVENATSFSGPGSQVSVSSAAAGSAVRLSITDHGIGLGEEEIADANERLGTPHPGEAVGAQRLGFFVVATLAARLGAQVRLRAGESGGVVAEVDLEPVLFVPDGPGAEGSTDQVLPPEETGSGPDVPQDIVPSVRSTGSVGELVASGPLTGEPAPPPPTAPQPPGAGTPAAPRPPVAGTPAPPPLPSMPLPPPPLPSPPLPPTGPQGPAAGGPAPQGSAPRAPGTPAAGASLIGEPGPFRSSQELPRRQSAPAASSPVPPASSPVPPASPPVPPASPPVPPTLPPAQSAPPVPPPVSPPPPPSAPVDPPTAGSAVGPAAVVPPRPATAPPPMTRNVLPQHHGRAGFRLGRRRNREQPQNAAAMPARPWLPAAPVPPGPRVPAPGGVAPGPVDGPVSAGGPVDGPDSAGGPVDGPGSAGGPAHGSVPAPRPVPDAAGPSVAPEVPAAPRPSSAHPLEHVDEERLRHALTSEALSELSRLSSYSPAEVAPAPPSSLVRRTPSASPSATPAARPADPEPPSPEQPAAQRRLDPASVRDMLSGFQAGVRRGKSVPVGAADGPSQDWRASE